MADFEPDRHLISGVTVAAQAVITTNLAHGYSTGWYVRVQVPADYGMRIDYVQTKIVEVPSTTTVKVDVDTRQLAAFVAPSGSPSQAAQIVPISGVTQNVAV